MRGLGYEDCGCKEAGWFAVRLSEAEWVVFVLSVGRCEMGKELTL